MEELERSDIQGLVISAYGHLKCATYLLLHITDPGAVCAWFNTIADEITTSEGKREGFSMNVALTARGLTRLGLDEDALRTFPGAFLEGMASERRAQILGDQGGNAAAQWLWGGPAQKEVHLLLMIFADEDKLDAQVERQRAAFRTAGAVEELLALTAGRQPDSRENREHFGFVDGIGQPVIEGSGNLKKQRQRTGHATELKPGEFLLGYINEYGVPSDSPTVAAARDPRNLLPPAPKKGAGRNDRKGRSPGGPGRHDLGRNGSYLVLRQMAQDVAGFWQFLDRATRDAQGQPNAQAEVRLGAKFVGRWPSGAPLVKEPLKDPFDGTDEATNDNDFEYTPKDPYGARCPIGAHIRRSNPRDTLGPDPQTALGSARRHRLMRRGRSYGPRLADPHVNDGQERGLVFICLQSDLERQFEFVQQTWINNTVFGGLDNEVDPLIGNQVASSGRMTVQGDPLRTRVHNLSSFVTVKGGAYFFLPGIRALRYLGCLAAERMS